LIDDIIIYEPKRFIGGENEAEKRQMGIDWINQKEKFSHFIMLDCDEYYQKKCFRNAQKCIINNHINGSVIHLTTYFKKPTLKIEGFDNYYVPFIHRLKPDSCCGTSVSYPYKVDPTRRINEKNVRLFSPNMIYMHHYSYVRANIHRKINNSSARYNLENTTIIDDYKNARAGYYLSNIYNKTLIAVENIFNINIDAEN